MEALKQPTTHWLDLNRKLKERSSSDSPFTPISHFDRHLYQDFFRKAGNYACYGNSWTYITQACRGLGSGLGLKYHDGKSLLSIGSHDGHYVVVRPLGRINKQVIRVLDVLTELSGKPVFIKKVFPDQAIRLFELGTFQEAIRRRTVDAEPLPGEYLWHPTSFADDDTFPEIILDVNVTLRYDASPKKWLQYFHACRKSPLSREKLNQLFRRYLKFRSKVNKFACSGTRYSLVDYNTEKATEVRRFLVEHFGEQDSENIQAYENMLLKPPLGNNGHSFFSFATYLDRDTLPKAFFVAETLDSRSAGLYAAVASRCCRGLSEYLHVEVLSRLKRQGIRYLNLGGSEVRSLHEFKLKFGPIEERDMQLLVYGVR